MNNSSQISNKEPWLAVNLSMFFPGIGQIYAGKIFRGSILIISQFCLICIAIYFWFSPEGKSSISKIYLLVSISLSIWNLFDAYRCAKQNNSNDFELLRKSSKDPWLAVFLSRLIVGLGHIYLKKYFFGSLLIVWAITPHIFSSSRFSFFLFIAIYLLSPFIFYHTYIVAPVIRDSTNEAILKIALVSLSIRLLLLFIIFIVILAIY